MHAKPSEPEEEKQRWSFVDLESESYDPHASTQGMVGANVQSEDHATGRVTALETKPNPTQAKDVTKSRKVHHVRSRSDTVQQHHAMVRHRDMKLSPSFPYHLSKSLKTRRSLLDEGSRIVPPTECFFPQPQKGQSLTSFLSSSDFSNCAELDKENAHFYVSEALISALEQMRWRKAVYGQSDDDGHNSEEEETKQRIRIRRREKMPEKIVRPLELHLSDGLTDTPTSLSPASSFNSSASCQAEESDHDIEDFDLLSESGITNLSLAPDHGLSLSMASLYADTDIKKLSLGCNSPEVLSKLTSSAEVVALSLLKNFSEKHLPKASELVWLVSEADAPQSLLPLPDSWPISPDEALDGYDVPKTRLRGNLEWAPPREQIILSVRAKPRLRMQLAAQNYRCAGCGMRVSQALASGLRYCEYLSKLFCHCCHNNSTAVIPARVLHHWDFGRYPVSKFARDLLDRLAADPLFNVQDLNPSLYKRSSMSRARDYRLALHHLQQYVQTCRHAVELQEELKKFPPYLLNDPDLYSLEDLQQVRSGVLVESLKKTRKECLNHCTQCSRCRAQGFICEGCHDGTDILFPYQLSSTLQCPSCRACFHHKCYVPGKCPKCLRLEKRRKTWTHQEYASS